MLPDLDEEEYAKTRTMHKTFVQNSEKVMAMAEEWIQDSEKMWTTWDEERQELNMGEFLKAEQFLSRLSQKERKDFGMKLWPWIAESRNRNAHRLDLPISIKQVTKCKDLNFVLIFEALFGISQDEVQVLLKMDERCGGIFRVKSIVEYHGTLYARQMLQRFLPLFKQWLEGIRKVLNQIDDRTELTTCRGHATLKASALTSTIDDKLLQAVKRVGQSCEESYIEDNFQPAESNHSETIAEDWRERAILSRFGAIQAKAKQDSADAETYSK
ncbi:uncharacterized protein EAE97_006328 [Botrytis byssoidea]|uniref:Uncharacterized protein n=1 Tax=Botrytis byssoidea TaxID=139641 RepID=A0A9P5IQG4_9HELO|nr:uncharacterized protein EAE97_006328 [Botrytis byssoidea]KAF7942874.1 hypothetical protein EAE97_006328 [Botrytis byssoidea]